MDEEAIKSVIVETANIVTSSLLDFFSIIMIIMMMVMMTMIIIIIIIIIMAILIKFMLWHDYDEHFDDDY